MSFNGDLNGSDEGTDLTTKGQIHTYSTENTALNVGTDSYILSAASGETTGLEWVANTDAGLTLGSKGDIHTRSASDQAALAVGANLKSLYANSAETTGLEWNTNARETLTTAGDILYASGTNTLARLAKGADTEVLTLASGIPSWAAAGGSVSLATNRSEITTGFTTTSTSFVDSGLTITVSNNSGGKGNILSSVGLYNSDANRWSIMSVYNSTDSATVQQQGAMGNGYNVTAGAVVDLDGDTYVLRLRNDSSGYTAGFHANVWMTAAFWSFEVY